MTSEEKKKEKEEECTELEFPSRTIALDLDWPKMEEGVGLAAADIRPREGVEDGEE